MHARTITPIAVAVIVASVLDMAPPHERGPGPAGAQELTPNDFVATITHPLFPLSLVGPKVFEGEEADPDSGETIELRLESRLLPQTDIVDGVTVAVLEERDYEDGELVEVALDYFAQHRDGTVYYFGERVDNYEDGELRDHHGTWLAGEGGAEPGIIMPAQPALGQRFQQERAPGVAEDEAVVEALGESVKVPAGSYDGCMRTRDTNPLEPGTEESKWYCPGVGLVKEESDKAVNELVSVAPVPAASPAVAGPINTSPTPVAGIAAPGTGNGSATGGWPLRVGMALAAIAVGAFGLAAGVRRLRRQDP